MANSKKSLECSVLLLDNRTLVVHLSPRAFGQDLCEAVHRDLQLVETDYFGLEYKAADDTDCWLEKQKPIVSQVGRGRSYIFKFKVKFYPADPTTLKEEYTRYLFALQLRQDLACGRLQCCARTAAALAAYAVQSELGDHEAVAPAAPEVEEDEIAYIRNIPLVAGQTEELERSIVEQHRTLSGQKPADADFNLLDAARKTDFYGVVLSQVKDTDGVPQSLAVTEAGILVFQNNQRVNTFSWSKIRKLSFRRKIFYIKLRPAADKAHPSNLVNFLFPSRSRSKAFWKACIEHHAFFCCREAPSESLQRSRSSRFAPRFTFRYSGRTQVQLIDHVKDNLVKSRPFLRSQSFCAMSTTRSFGATSQGSAAAASSYSVASPSAAGKASSLDHRVLVRSPAAIASKESGATRSSEEHAASKGVVPIHEAGHKGGHNGCAASSTLPSSTDISPAVSGCIGDAADSNGCTPENGVHSGSSDSSPAAAMPSGVCASRPDSSSVSDGSPTDAGQHRADGGRSREDEDAESLNDADSLAKLEDAIRSLAAADVTANGAAPITGDPNVAAADIVLQRQISLSAEVERAARQQAKDDVLIACRASSLRCGSLRRSSTRSTEEEMAQLEDVSDIAIRVLSNAPAGDEKACKISAGPQMNGRLLGRGQRLSSLQDLCELASKVMQYDDITLSTPALAGAADLVLRDAVPQMAPDASDSSPPPLPEKHQDTTGCFSPPPLPEKHQDITLARPVARSAPQDVSLANDQLPDTTVESSDAPPLPPKCNPLGQGSLPRDFARGGRAADPCSWKGVHGLRFPIRAALDDYAGTCASDNEIHLPVRCTNTKSRSSSSSSSDSSRSSSSLSDEKTPVGSAAAGERIIRVDRAVITRGSAAIDDELNAALAVVERSAANPSPQNRALEPTIRAVDCLPVNANDALLIPCREAPANGDQAGPRCTSDYAEPIWMSRLSSNTPVSPGADDVFSELTAGTAGLMARPRHTAALHGGIHGSLLPCNEEAPETRPADLIANGDVLSDLSLAQ